MKPFRFAKGKSQGLFTYHYLTREERIVDVPFPSDDASWWNQWDSRPFDRYNISGLVPVWNGIYLAFIWHLICRLPLYGMPIWHRDESSKNLAKDPHLIKWEYSVERPGNRGVIEDAGFTIPRTSPGPLGPEMTPIDPWKAHRTHLAGLFRITSFQDFIDLQKPGLTEAASQVNYLGIPHWHLSEQTLTELLQSDTRPDLPRLLGDNGIFANLYLGIDQGYPDSLLIKTKKEIGESVDDLARGFESRIGFFEQEMVENMGIDAYIVALERLLSL